jgi:hypothetical protein
VAARRSSLRARVTTSRHNPGVTTAPDDFSRGQRFAFVASAALTTFAMAFDEMRRLMDLAAAEGRRRTPPAALRKLGREVSVGRPPGFIRGIERAVDLSRRRATDHIEHAQEPSPTAPAAPTDTGVRHPIALEQAIAVTAINAGPPLVRSLSAEVTAATGGHSGGLRYAVAYLWWRNGPPVTTRLATSMLAAATANFEDLLGALYRTRGLVAAVETDSVSTTDAGEFASPDDRVRHDIDRSAKALLKKRPGEWRDAICNDMGIDVAELGVDWAHVNEVFARRNVIIHAEGRVDKDYRARTRSELELGTPLVCDEEYFRAAVDTLERLGTALAVCWLARLFPEGPEPAELAAVHILWALEKCDWVRARAMATAVVEGRTPTDVPPEVRVNWWMARRHCGEGVAGIRSEVETWPAPDDDLDYRLAKAALLLDATQCRALAAEYRGQVPQNVREWPLVAELVKVHPALETLFRLGPSSPRRRRQRR